MMTMIQRNEQLYWICGLDNAFCNLDVDRNFEFDGHGLLSVDTPKTQTIVDN